MTLQNPENPMWDSHKDLNLTESDHKALMMKDEWLSSDIIDAFLRILQNKNEHIRFIGPYNMFIAPDTQLQDGEKFITVLNTSSDGSHCLTCSNVVTKEFELDDVYVYDSLYTSINKFVQKQIKTIYGRGQIWAKVYEVEKQDDLNSCGMFALLNAATLVLGKDPTKHAYGTPKELRDGEKMFFVVEKSIIQGV